MRESKQVSNKQYNLVRPEDISAPLYHLLGIDPHTEVHDSLNRPLAISGGTVISDVMR